jgi:biopolymer transport protein ExbB
MKHLACTFAAAALAALVPNAAFAQQQAPTFDGAARDAQAELEKSLAELSRLRERIASEKIPLTKSLSQLEGELVKARQDYQQASSLLANRSLDLTTLTNEIKAREEEVAYLANLLGEYMRNFESGLHIAELQRYRKPLEDARLAAENDSLPRREAFEAQAKALMQSLERLHDSFGGAKFEGTAVDAGGMVREGTFVLAGPISVFRAKDGSVVGTAGQRLGSLEPALTAFENPELAKMAGDFVASGAGAMPVDPTNGNAHKIAATEETLAEHIAKGGPVMWPIFILGGAAMFVGIFKWITMLAVKMPGDASVRAVMRAVGAGDRDAAVRLAGELKGPLGAMLASGAQALGQPRDAIEESMYETVQRTQHRLQALLPFVAISASAAPLLGLLGTVTGIMNTFSLITIYGTGDVKTLSSGISEALITTEYGLIVAIPSLLLHAFLSSKVRKIVNRLETTGVSFINEIARAEAKASAAVVEPKAPVPAPVSVPATSATA